MTGSSSGADRDALIHIYMGLFGLSVVPAICGMGIGLIAGYGTWAASPLLVKVLFAPMVAMALVGCVAFFGIGGYTALKGGFSEWRSSR